MLNVMDAYYDNMKNDMGIQYFKSFETDDKNLDDILSQLRPNTTISNFKDFLSQTQMSVSKSAQWRNY